VALHKIVRREDAVVLAHRVTDTIRSTAVRAACARLTGSTSGRWKTPQVFSRKLICRAYAAVAQRKLAITDDAAAR